jgi:hypothetical protein
MDEGQLKNVCLSVVCCLLSVVCCLLSVVCCLFIFYFFFLLSCVFCFILSVVFCLLSVVCCLLSVVCCLLSVVCCLSVCLLVCHEFVPNYLLNPWSDWAKIFFTKTRENVYLRILILKFRGQDTRV